MAWIKPSKKDMAVTFSYYLYWGRSMKINSDTVEVKWNCEEQAHGYFHHHVHATLEAAFAMVHEIAFAKQALSSSCSHWVVFMQAKSPTKQAFAAPVKRPRAEAFFTYGLAHANCTPLLEEKDLKK